MTISATKHMWRAACIINTSHMPCGREVDPTAWAVQAAQVRKSHYVPDKGVEYDPEKHHTCTVYAGTIVQQVTVTRVPTSRQSTHPSLCFTGHSLFSVPAFLLLAASAGVGVCGGGEGGRGGLGVGRMCT